MLPAALPALLAAVRLFGAVQMRHLKLTLHPLLFSQTRDVEEQYLLRVKDPALAEELR